MKPIGRPLADRRLLVRRTIIAGAIRSGFVGCRAVWLVAVGDQTHGEELIESPGTSFRASLVSHRGMLCAAELVPSG